MSMINISSRILGTCFADDNMWQDWGGSNCQYYATRTYACKAYNKYASSNPGYPETNPCCACKGNILRFASYYEIPTNTTLVF
jgi:hypothetical protein